jgi:thioredoxin-related protein
MLCSHSLQAETPRGNWHANLDAAWKQSQDSGQPMLLFVTMNGCTYCNKMAQHTFADAGVKADLASSYVTASVDGTKHPEVARQLKVRAYPATFLVGPDTRVLDRIDGFVTATELRQRLAKARQLMAATSTRQAQLPR